MRRESDSALIDRLILGRPSSETLLRRMQAMLERDWYHHEIGAQYGMTADAVAMRLCRARRDR